MNLTTFRGLDPALGRWCQVDPKAEAVSSLSPYQSMGNNPISNVDPHGDLFWALPNISFDGGFRIGLTVGAGPFSASASYGSGGFAWNAGVGAGPVSASYGSGGFNVGAGAGVNVNGFNFNLGSVGYGSGGFGTNGPSIGYGHKFGGENQTSSSGVHGSMNTRFYGIIYAIRILQQSILPEVEISGSRHVHEIELAMYYHFNPPPPLPASGAITPVSHPLEWLLGGWGSSADDLGILGFSALKNFSDDALRFLPMLSKTTIDKLLASAQVMNKNGLTVAGRALQKHTGRPGPFNSITFSHKTANQQAMDVLNSILNSKNPIIQAAGNGGYRIFDGATGRGFGLSRSGLFNGFRQL